ncbi:MAG TPA: PAS domain-containing sensor histidine kinase [Casimicrobiaceae bacterium]|nr:PAS domain-containing sensor histidine kinase [Casimicrobiaceae bacterium]
MKNRAQRGDLARRMQYLASDASTARQRLTDLTEAAGFSAREAERQRAISDGKFAAFMANIPYPAFIQDENGDLMFMNAAAESSPAWRDVASSLPTADAAASLSHSPDDPHYFCIRFPVVVEGRRWLGGIAIDVTNRIRDDRALRERTTEIETLFACVPAPLWIARDARGDEIVGNPAANALLGIDPDSPASAPAHWQFVCNSRPVERDELPIRIAMRERRIVPGTDMEAVRADGVRRYVRVTAAPLYDEKGDVRGAVAAALDISQLKLYEAELERAVRRRDEFLAVLAHELRNPLAPIRNSVQILQRAPGDNERVQRATALIDRQTSLLVRLIDDLVDVARISQGLVSLELAPRSLAAIVTGAVDQVRAAAQLSGHAIGVEHAQPDALVLVDALRAEQILVNVLSNALKYSLPRTRVAVTSWTQGDCASIAVTDEGQGIPAEHLADIFTMFVRPGLEARGRISGFGVGLGLAKQLCEHQGGTIAVHSEGRGRGATFTISFPLAHAEANAAD